MADTPGADNLAARLDALRQAGAAERDPVRLAYIEALSRRAAAQPAAIRQPLQARLAARLDELTARLVACPDSTATTGPETANTPLADLLVYIGQHNHDLPDASQPLTSVATVNRKHRPKSNKAPSGATAPGPELKAISMFRDAWSKLSTEQQLTQTLAQAPENAGPMNSQHLVLRSLQLMRDVAPDYLQGFMSHIDTLIWLEQADPARAASRSSAGDSEKKPRVAKRGAAKR